MSAISNLSLFLYLNSHRFLFCIWYFSLSILTVCVCVVHVISIAVRMAGIEPNKRIKEKRRGTSEKKLVRDAGESRLEAAAAVGL